MVYFVIYGRVGSRNLKQH